MRKQKLILSIDDEELVRNSFRMFLSEFGFDVIVGEDGKSGLKLFYEHSPDLVLLDLKMPGMNGIQVLQKMIKADPSIPVIVVSGVGIIQEAMEAIRQGAWDYLLKPVEDLNILLHSVKNALEKSELLQQNKKYQMDLESMVASRTMELELSNKKLSQEIEYRKEVEVQLHKSRQILSSVIETVPDIIYRVNKNGKINFISDAVKNYGYQKTDFINKSIFDFINHEDRKRSYWHLLERRTGSRKTKNFTIPFLVDHKNPPIFMLESEGIYTEAGEHFIGTQGILRDITARIKAENKIKKSLQEKKALLREIHHRVKNNMQIILSLLNLQMRDIKNPKIQEILKQSQNRILSMTIVHESIYKNNNFAQIEIKQFIKEFYNRITNSYLIGKQITVDYDIETSMISLDSSVPLAIILNEIITNIFKHAFKGQKTGNVMITVKIIQENFAKVKIEDNGVGFSKKPNMKKPKTMGLSLIKTLTKQLEGEINIDHLDMGTRITFTCNTQLSKSSL